MRRRVLIALLAIGLGAAACGSDSAVVPAPSSTTIDAPPESTSTTTAPATATDVSRFLDDFAQIGCFDVVYAGGDFDYAAGAAAVSCGGPHDHEVFRVGALDGEPGAPYPGDDAVASAVFDEQCIDEFSSRFGPWSDTVDLALWAAFPFQAEWEAGVRTFACSVTGWSSLDGGDPLVGDVTSAGLTLTGVDLAVMTEYDGRDVYIYPFDDVGARQAERNLSADGNDGVEDLGIPSWSPDGSMIAIGIVDAVGQWDIWVIDAATGDATQLNSDAPVDSSPVFSPDGTRIAFTSRDRGQGERDIWVMDSDGSNLVQLTDDPGADSSPHWSPDGARIVFRSNRTGSSDIWVMNADGSDQQMFTGFPDSDEYDPRWSPDGQTIAFISDQTGDFDIWLAGVDGSDPIDLTTHPADDEYPSWTPDGQFILFNSTRRGSQGLWIMRADGSEQSDLLRTFPVGWGSVRP